MSATDAPPVFGAGRHRYRFQRDWARLPHWWNFGEAGHPGPPRTCVKGAVAASGDVHGPCNAARHTATRHEPRGTPLGTLGLADTARPTFYVGHVDYAGHVERAAARFGLPAMLLAEGRADRDRCRPAQRRFARPGGGKRVCPRGMAMKKPAVPVNRPGAMDLKQ